MKHCRVGGAFGMTLPFDCPADHILNLPRWFTSDLPIAFREAGFLSTLDCRPRSSRAGYA